MTLPTTVVTVDCPCCGVQFVEVTLIQGNWPEDPHGWDVDDFDSGCGCADYMEHMPKTTSRKGIEFNEAPTKYRDDLRERALAQL